jgi:AcrR family transcriptional regulator
MTTKMTAMRSQRETGLQIREVALGLFAEQGYAATSMRAIAAAVGIEPASLYHHFRSKEDIVWDLTSTAWEELEATVAAELDGLERATPVDRLRAFVRAHVAFHGRFAASARLVNLNLDALGPHRRRVVVERRDRYEQRLRRILEAGQAQGAFRIATVEISSMALLQCCSSVALWFDADGPMSLDAIAAEFETVALRIVGAPEAAERVAIPADDTEETR